MAVAKSRRKLVWVVAIFSAAVLAGVLFTATGDAEAYQPIGMRVSESQMPEPPCPYGHDDGCETAAPPLYSVNPFQSDNPHDHHAHAHTADAGHNDHHEHLRDIAALNQRVSARLADSDEALNSADGESDEPGVSYAITSDIAGLPWVTSNPTKRNC